MNIRIGTRGSPLALAQAREVQSKLAEALNAPRDNFPIVEIKTSGDKILDRPLSEVGGKGLFTKEIEEALYARTVDIAVHSMKDLETVMPPGLEIGAVLPREDVRDAFISLKYPSLAEVPKGARVGTSSLRRRAQLRHVRPDLEVVEFRGNVQTRLRKLEDGIADATFLACAGLNRLGQAERITSPIATTEMLPAVAQGAIAIQMRVGDGDIIAALRRLDHAPTRTCVDIERAFLRELD
ncbi:MAG: hydroxymethylbilane synthase, partial [Hyphomicrobiaceae bacterium]|nr:hydroxymethylbilane synthase [Hyphomicrobiaceae bacterium]